MAMACNSMSRKHLKTSAHKELQSAHKVPGWIGCGRNKQRKVVQLCLRTLSRLRAATLPSKSEKVPCFPFSVQFCWPIESRWPIDYVMSWILNQSQWPNGCSSLSQPVKTTSVPWIARDWHKHVYQIWSDCRFLFFYCVLLGIGVSKTQFLYPKKARFLG